MPRKRYKPEEIGAKLRQVDVLVSQGQVVADAIRQIGVSEVTYYRWRQEFGGLKIEQVKRLKERCANQRPRRVAAAEVRPTPGTPWLHQYATHQYPGNGAEIADRPAAQTRSVSM